MCRTRPRPCLQHVLHPDFLCLYRPVTAKSPYDPHSWFHNTLIDDATAPRCSLLDVLLLHRYAVLLASHSSSISTSLSSHLSSVCIVGTISSLSVATSLYIVLLDNLLSRHHVFIVSSNADFLCWLYSIIAVSSLTFVSYLHRCYCCAYSSLFSFSTILLCSRSLACW